MKKVFIASDHGGFDLKNYLVGELKTRDYEVDDLGPDTYIPTDDYTDYLSKIGDKLLDNTIGIVICKNGVGVSIFANKCKGVRCALSWNPQHVQSARNDDDVNILALPAEYVSQEVALETTLAFLETPFGNEERHVRRLKKIPA